MGEASWYSIISRRHDTLEELVRALIQKVDTMAIDTTKIAAAVNRLVSDVQAFIAANPGAADAGVQASLDALTTTLTAESLVVEAASVGPSGATGVTGTTGVSGTTGS
jgi:outer membrane murein-binding lipoprotein Lpp